MGDSGINSQTQSLGQNSVCIQQNAPFDSNNCLNSGIQNVFDYEAESTSSVEQNSDQSNSL